MTPPSSTARPAGAGGAARPPDAGAPTLGPDVCRLCGRRIEASDSVASGGDDVVHASCYDRSIENPPSDLTPPAG